MNYTETIKRAFRITWSHRSLWLLGFLASLSSGSGSGGSFSTDGAGGQQGADQLPGWMNESQIGRWLADNSGAILAVICVLLCLFLVIWLVTLVLGEIGQGGLIANVDGIERGDTPSFRDGWRSGVARARTLVGMRLLLALPGLLIALIFGSIAVLLTVGAIGSATDGNDAFAALMGIGVFGVLCLIFPLLCLFAIYSVIVNILETFGRRAIMLENLGAIDGIKRGWAVFRGRIGDSIVLAILMAVISFVVGITIAVPLLVFGVGAAFGTAALSGGWNDIPWALVAVGVLLFLALAIVLSSFFTAVNSAVWTLAYREFTAAGGIAATTTTPPPLPPVPPTEGSAS